MFPTHVGVILDDDRLFKRGSRGNMFSSSLKPNAVISESGYEVRAVSIDQQGQAQMDDLQKLNLAINVMPNNAALKRIYKEKILKTIDLTAEEVNEIKLAEEQAQQMMEQDMLAQQQAAQMGQQLGASGQAGQAPMIGGQNG